MVLQTYCGVLQVLSAGKDRCDGAVVPFERLCHLSDCVFWLCLCPMCELLPFFHLSGFCDNRTAHQSSNLHEELVLNSYIPKFFLKL